MKAVLSAAVLLALAGPVFSILPLGDNGMTTYTGRKREPNTLVFGNQMVVDQGVNAMLELTKQMLSHTWKPTPNDPATEKTEVRISQMKDSGLLLGCCELHKECEEVM